MTNGVKLLICLMAIYGIYGNDMADVDECAEGTDNCHVNARCSNTNGSFVCTCNDGYTGTGQNCTDIDECEAAYNCQVRPSCRLSYEHKDYESHDSCHWECPSGYTMNGHACIDPECDVENSAFCHLDAHCTNTEGSYSCKCRDLYVGDGKSCNGFLIAIIVILAVIIVFVAIVYCCCVHK